MKKLFCLLLVALLLCTLAACGHEDTVQKPAAEDAEGTAAVDVDLTALSGIMVYSEVNSMISFPDNYIGKTVKMQGQFTIYQATDENGAFIPDKMFFACMIADATACCAQGLEFALAGKPVYPDEYPELGAEITVVGTFEWYEEDGCRYYRLGNAAFVSCGSVGCINRKFRTALRSRYKQQSPDVSLSGGLPLIVRCPLSRGMQHPLPHRIRTGKHLCMRSFLGFDPPFSSSRPRSRAAPHRRKGSLKSAQPLRRRESVPIAGTPDARPPQRSAYIVLFPHKETLRSY